MNRDSHLDNPEEEESWNPVRGIEVHYQVKII